MNPRELRLGGIRMEVAGRRYVDPIVFLSFLKNLRPAFKMVKFPTKPRFLESFEKWEGLAMPGWPS